MSDTETSPLLVQQPEREVEPPDLEAPESEVPESELSELEQARARIEHLKAQLHQTQASLETAREEIAAMKTSKFWKMREAWLKIKGAIDPRSVNKPLTIPILSGGTEPANSASASANSAPSPVVPDSKQPFATLYTIALQNFLAAQAKLILPTSPDPLVSIILILYNRAELTFQCLQSICASGFDSFEVIIVDNSSSDQTHQLLAQVEGAKIIYNLENIHFLLGSNQAAQAASGKYLLFLNNDAQLLPGSITSAINTIKSSTDIGAVGGKIILLDGTLQEAGSIVWNDGSCLGYGRGGSPFAPMYMFMRDVDYCSGAFLLTEREVFFQVGKFDEDYKPAYYEETDYCLKLWKSGRRIVYDPNTVILHYEFASSKSTEAAIQLQIDHRNIFLQKNAEKLKAHYSPSEANILLARSAAGKPNHRVLFIDDRVPHPHLGSGYPRSRDMLLSLVEMGCDVTLYPLTFWEEAWESIYADIPRTVEVMIGYGIERLESFLRERFGYYDVLIVSRPHNMQYLKQALVNLPDWTSKTRIVYDAEAIFALREAVRDRLHGIPRSESDITADIRREIEVAKGADAIISVSAAESQRFADYGFSTVHTLGHTLAIAPTTRPFAERSHILFVGAIHEDASPNADSVIWFVQDVFPLIRQQLQQDVKFLIAGFNKSTKILDLESDDVQVLGRVDDLTKVYNQARIFVAPTRFAAGLPFKVHHAAAHGVPIVCTSLIAAQVGWQPNEALLVADTPSDFAQKCVELYQNADLWETLRSNSLKQVEAECSKDAFVNNMHTILNLKPSVVSSD